MKNKNYERGDGSDYHDDETPGNALKKAQSKLTFKENSDHHHQISMKHITNINNINSNMSQIQTQTQTQTLTMIRIPALTMKNKIKF